MAAVKYGSREFVRAIYVRMPRQDSLPPLAENYR